jgi:hypothetical protein
MSVVPPTGVSERSLEGALEAFGTVVRRTLDERRYCMTTMPYARIAPEMERLDGRR